MDLSVVIVNWKSKDFVLAAVRSIFAHTRDLRFEIVVVDGGSFDGCGEALAAAFPAVRFIQSARNLGFGRANNLGAAQASGELLVFLNPDTELTGPALNRLREAAAARPDAGALGARLLNSDGTLQTSCLQAFPTLTNLFLDADWLRRRFPTAALWGTAPLYAATREPVAVEGISGACLATPRRVFERVGGFTPDYFMYFEDMDYCLKVREAGWTNYYVPSAELIHHGGKSSGAERNDFATVMMAEAAHIFFRRRHGRGRAAAFRLSAALKALLRVTLLAAAYPLAALAGRGRRAGVALHKWLRVLRWACGREKWVADYA